MMTERFHLTQARLDLTLEDGLGPLPTTESGTRPSVLDPIVEEPDNAFPARSPEAEVAEFAHLSAERSAWPRRTPDTDWKTDIIKTVGVRWGRSSLEILWKNGVFRRLARNE